MPRRLIPGWLVISGIGIHARRNITVRRRCFQGKDARIWSPARSAHRSLGALWNSPGRSRKPANCTQRLAGSAVIRRTGRTGYRFSRWRLPADLEQKAREMGGLRLMDWLEDGLSHFLRVSDREAIAYGDARERSRSAFRRARGRHGPAFHLSSAGLQPARRGNEIRRRDGARAGRLGARAGKPAIDGGDVRRVCGGPVHGAADSGWKRLHLPRARDGSRKGRLLLIEKAGETDFASRYTVKRYARQGALGNRPNARAHSA